LGEKRRKIFLLKENLKKLKGETSLGQIFKLEKSLCRASRKREGGVDFFKDFFFGGERTFQEV